MRPHFKRGFKFGKHDHHHMKKGFKKMAKFGPGKDQPCKRMFRRSMSESSSSSSSDHEDRPCFRMSDDHHHGKKFMKHHPMGMGGDHHGKFMKHHHMGMGDDNHHGKMHKKFMKHHHMGDDHHGKKRHMKMMMMHHRRGMDDGIQGGKRHMMHHHMMGRHGHGRRGFWEEDCTVVPIIADEHVEEQPAENEDTAGQFQQSNGTEEPVEDGARTRNQGTQTTSIMEIVLEDQEALNAVIRIVNRFL